MVPFVGMLPLMLCVMVAIGHGIPDVYTLVSPLGTACSLIEQAKGNEAVPTCAHGGTLNK